MPPIPSRFVRTLIAVVTAVLSSTASAAAFFDNFEFDLGGWTGKGGGGTNGRIVTDPLNAANKVLNFSALNSAGDILSRTTFANAGDYLIEFDYLGRPPATGGGVAGDRGGFFGLGILSGDPCNCWLAGTQDAYTGAFGPVVPLIDNGQWGHYAFLFKAGTQPALNVGFRLMLEDFSGSGGVPGDAYFDNVTVNRAVSAVPEPSTVSLLLGAFALAAFARRKAA